MVSWLLPFLAHSIIFCGADNVRGTHLPYFFWKHNYGCTVTLLGLLSALREEEEEEDSEAFAGFMACMQRYRFVLY